ncbi:hypothetical protein [Sphingomonas sp. URHD0057]|uniref:hypothetical protein n=1 Tax=Sphingomonas sp. URHD0057 TaxID=1380389 RepID=UPI000B30EB40|nr:hypothetical protein [Sphingomonas sp. URHD0057]
MNRLTRIALLAAALPLAACSSLGGGEYGIGDYTLIRVHRVNVGDGGMSVVAPRPWNERRRSILFDDVREVEDWTLNGPILDGISFVSGMKSGRYLIRQRRTADQQVPKFRGDMTPPEIAAMLESLYRVRGGAVDFRTLSLQPRAFLGANGFQLDYEHLDSDELWRKGRAVGVVIDGRLYLILLDAARSHYYNATLPDFEAIVASAQLRR